MVWAKTTFSKKWTSRKPTQKSLQPIEDLTQTKSYLAHAKLANPCLVCMLKERLSCTIRAFKIRVLRNIAHCPARKRATHASQNKPFANLLRPY